MFNTDHLKLFRGTKRKNNIKDWRKPIEHMGNLQDTKYTNYRNPRWLRKWQNPYLKK